MNIIKQNETFVAWADMPDELYRNTLGLSNSMLKHFMRTPAHYKQAVETKQEPTKAMILGTALHQMVLTPELDLVVAMPDVDLRTTKGKAIRDEFVQNSIGKTVIKEEELIVIQGMAKSVLAHPEASKLLKSCTYKEASMFAKLRGVDCKGRVDMLDADNGVIGDLKSCEDASVSGVRKAIRNFRYDIQNVQYSELFQKIFLKRLSEFKFIFVEKEPPYAVCVYKIGEHTIAQATEEWNRSVDFFNKCNHENVWPCYSEETITIEI